MFNDLCTFKYNTCVVDLPIRNIISIRVRMEKDQRCDKTVNISTRFDYFWSLYKLQFAILWPNVWSFFPPIATCDGRRTQQTESSE